MAKVNDAVLVPCIWMKERCRIRRVRAVSKCGHPMVLWFLSWRVADDVVRWPVVGRFERARLDGHSTLIGGPFWTFTPNTEPDAEEDESCLNG